MGSIYAGMKSQRPLFEEDEIRHEVSMRGRRIRDMLGEYLCSDFDYCCVEEYIAEHGKMFEKVAMLPEGCAQMRVGKCFDNALALHDFSGSHLTYCEGYAGPHLLHHAWCVSNDGTVIDPTWVGEHTDYYTGPYFGCVFADARSSFMLLKTSGRYDRFSKLITTFPGFMTSAMPHIFTARKGSRILMEAYGPWLTSKYAMRVFNQHKKESVGS